MTVPLTNDCFTKLKNDCVSLTNDSVPLTNDCVPLNWEMTVFHQSEK